MYKWCERRRERARDERYGARGRDSQPFPDRRRPRTLIGNSKATHACGWWTWLQCRSAA